MIAADAPIRFLVRGIKGSLIKHRGDPQEDQLVRGERPGSPGWGYDPDPLLLVTSPAEAPIKIAAPAGQYNLSAIYPGSMISNVSISITSGQTVNKALYGSARARVSGTVVDENKRGIGGARLAARNAARDGGPIMLGPGRIAQDTTAFSGPDGRFVLRNVVAETDVQIDATKKGFPNARSSSLRLNPGERKSGLMITIPRGVAFSGKVTDSNGRPVSGVGVEPAESTGRGGFAMVRRAVNFMARDREDEIVRTGSDGTTETPSLVCAAAHPGRIKRPARTAAAQ